MKFLTLPFLLMISNVCLAQTTVIKLPYLEKLVSDNQGDKILVVNFWATWCAPCVKELPLFESYLSAHQDKVNVKLISLDYADKLQKVNAFVTRKKIKSEVLLLDEIDGNTWIDKIE